MGEQGRVGEVTGKGKEGQCRGERWRVTGMGWGGSHQEGGSDQERPGGGLL